MELHDIHPKFQTTPTSYTVDLNATAILECSIEDLLDRQVIWRKATEEYPLTVGTETFQNSDRIIIEHQPGRTNWNLIIHQVRLADAGVYECQVSSQFKHLRHHVLLTVKDTTVNPNSTPVPRPYIQIIGSQYVEKESDILLTCNATGLEHAPEDLDWFFNGNKLQGSRRLSIKKQLSITSRSISGVLEIRGAQLDDSGLYVCRTSNLQIESLRVTVLNADSYNVKRGTFAGNRDKSKADHPDDEVGHMSEQRSGAHAQVRHRHLLTSVLMVLAANLYWLFPS